MANNELMPDERDSLPVEPTAQKSRRALSRLKRELSEEELASPGVQKMLIEELERTEEEVSELRGYRDKYYECDKKLALASSSAKRGVAGEIILSGGLAVGAAAVGYAPAIWSMQPTATLVLIFGLVVMIVGVVARVVQR